MIHLNQFHFYELGAALEPLRHLKDGEEALAVFDRFAEAMRMLAATVDDKSITLGTSRNSANKLREALGKWWSRMKAQLAAEQAVAPLTEAEVEAIQTALKNFEPVLAAELQEKPAYIVSEKAIFSTPALIERGDCIVDPDLQISAQARADLKQAGRCLAFELWTATGFHVFRATESVIVDYYEWLTKGATPLKPNDRNWGSYIKHLEDNGGDKKITGYLRYFKDNYRNPAVHPNVNLDRSEAIAVFQSTALAIVPMAKTITGP